MNKKQITLIVVLIVVISVSLTAYKVISFKNNDSEKSSNLSSGTITPTRSAELNGTVVSIEGNIIVINNEVGRKVLTPEEQDKRRAEMQKLSPEERQIARQKELEGVTYEKKEITIPVGIPIVIGTGDASGNSLPAELSDIKKDTYLSIWINASGLPEYVKIKGVN